MIERSSRRASRCSISVSSSSNLSSGTEPLVYFINSGCVMRRWKDIATSIAPTIASRIASWKSSTCGVNDSSLVSSSWTTSTLNSGVMSDSGSSFVSSCTTFSKSSASPSPSPSSSFSALRLASLAAIRSSSSAIRSGFICSNTRVNIGSGFLTSFFSSSGSMVASSSFSSSSSGSGYSTSDAAIQPLPSSSLRNSCLPTCLRSTTFSKSRPSFSVTEQAISPVLLASIVGDSRTSRCTASEPSSIR
mmetsp:Transcript_18637/g.30773  ORF Transcript_18637/g.30773 Transcript_18637/m.30773 type:complete len:247 (+) Transcript_18637:102-842(+)